MGSRAAASASRLLGCSLHRLSGFAGLPTDVVRGRDELAAEVERGDVPLADVVAGLRVAGLGTRPPGDAAERIFSEAATALTREALAWGFRLTNPFDRPDWQVMPFAVPMTVMHGRMDPVVAIECGEALARCSPNARFIALETDSHVLPLSMPNEVADAIRDAHCC